MCGIGGIVDLKGIDPQILMKMSRVLRHRGPDDEGFYLYSEEFQSMLKGDDTIADLGLLEHIREEKYHTSPILGLVHRRLSIIDIDYTGHQPMQYNGKQYTIVYNGEIYNYIELKDQLATKGYKFKTSSDTEVILASYAEWGYLCVEYFIGMWSFAIFDMSKNILFLSRDRFGIKPLYYSWENGRFSFASEAKALISTGLANPKANITASLEFILFGSNSDSSGNLFSEIKTLTPGYNLVYNITEQKINSSKFYNLEKEISDNKNSFDITNSSKYFFDLFSETLKIHLRSDVPVGSCLSGGLDSSSIVAVASRILGMDQIKTYTASFPGLNIDERPFVESLSNMYSNIKALFCYPDPYNLWDDLGKLIWHQDYPINSTSVYSQWEVMKLAYNNGAKVLLDGQGADEIFGGYKTFGGIYLINLLRSLKIRKFMSEYSALSKNLTPEIINTIFRIGFYFLPENIKKVIHKYRKTGYTLLSPDFKKQLINIQVPERGGKSIKELSLSSIKYGLRELLRYEDRNSMAFSIESRVPFLDHRLVEFIIGLSDDMKIQNGWTKIILRKSLQDLLPDEITWRRGKLGFVTPQNEWKVENQMLIKDYLHNISIPPILDKNQILLMLDSSKGNDNSTNDIWRILSFIKWSELFNISF